jgi:hypothetical protein
LVGEEKTVVTRRKALEQAENATRILARHANRLDNLIKGADPSKPGRFLCAEQDIEEIQKYLNSLRRSIARLSKPSTVKWQITDDIWSWGRQELLLGLLIGFLIGLIIGLKLASGG